MIFWPEILAWNFCLKNQARNFGLKKRLECQARNYGLKSYSLVCFALFCLVKRIIEYFAKE